MKFYISLFFVILVSCSSLNKDNIRQIASSEESIEDEVSEKTQEEIERIEEIAQKVEVSDKSFRRLVSKRWAASEVCILDFRFDHTVPRFLKRFRERRDRFHGVYVEAMCGSYEETKKMAIRKGPGQRLLKTLTRNAVAPFTVISKCKDGRVLVYESPKEVDISNFIDPEWCGGLD